MNWRDFLEEQATRRGREAFSYNPPATPDRIEKLEQEFAITLPHDLKELWLQTNGVSDGGFEFVFSIENFQEENRAFHSKPEWLDDFMPFDCLYFFSSALGNGDLFAYRILPLEGWQLHDIFRWDHENDTRIWAASDLKTWVEWYLDGKC